MITGTALGFVKLRSGPGTAWPATGAYLKAGDKIIVSENANQWLHITSINSIPATSEIWASAGTNEQYISWSEDTVVPPPVPVAEDYVLHYVDGMMVGRYNLQK